MTLDMVRLDPYRVASQKYLEQNTNFTVQGHLLVSMAIQNPVVTETTQTITGEEYNLNSVRLVLCNEHTIKLTTKTRLYLASLQKGKGGTP
jgi:hypothetical protein